MRKFAIGLILTAGAGAAALTGCLKHPNFECATATQCEGVGAGAVCEADGFCSLTDGACPSGRRYGDNSGPNSGQCVGAGPPPDAPIDQPPPADARVCFGSGAYGVCLAGAPMGTVNLSGTLDTDSDVRCLAAQPAEWTTAGQPVSCFITADQITVGSTTTVTGSRPLVLIAASITIDALLDASSHRGGGKGPAANATACAAFVSNATASAPVAAGGAGGSFMRRGGDGGRADNQNAKPGGVAPTADASAPALLRGGCAGQIGGANGANSGGSPGDGGGAIYLGATHLMITASGRINVSGAAGSGISNGGGGGGGGSGGMIVLTADALTASGHLLANGGGGAAGSDNQGNAGNNGSDPDPATPTLAAPGGNGAGGAGGDGFGGANQAQNGGSGNNKAGGGGGGGGGYIQSSTATGTASVSPTATIVP